MSRIVVTGSRKGRDRGLVYSALDRHHAIEPITLLIHGACPLGGYDWIAQDWASVRGIPFAGIPAWPQTHEWFDPKKGVILKEPERGPRRNRKMFEFHPGRLIAFPGGVGTADCIRAAQEYNTYQATVPLKKDARFCWIHKINADGSEGEV
jgi:hypothetical protein